MPKYLSIEDAHDTALHRKGECLSSKYTGCKNKLKWECEKGHVWLSTFSSIREGRWCPKCAHDNMRLGLNTVLEYCKNKDFRCSSTKYKNLHSKLVFRCNIDNYEWTASFYMIRKGYGCPRCSGRVCTIEDINIFLNTSTFTCISSNYTNAKSKLSFRCTLDNTIWENSFNNIQNGQGCPKCRTSKGEKKITKILDKLDIKFEEQKRFDNCKNKRLLSFDFYLSDHNMCIEYQGIQHFKPVKYFGGEQTFKKILKRDKVKREYCKDSNIKLIELTYKSFNNLEEIIKREVF